jgi:hypothetical protein
MAHVGSCQPQDNSHPALTTLRHPTNHPAHLPLGLLCPQQALHQLRMQRLQEAGEEARAGAQRRGLAAEQQLQEGAPLGEALQRLPHQERQEGKLELACTHVRQARWGGGCGGRFADRQERREFCRVRRNSCVRTLYHQWQSLVRASC